MRSVRSSFISVLVICIFAGSVSAQRVTLPVSSYPSPEATTENDSDPLSDFPEKGLPPAAVIGANPSVESGASLARAVMKFEDDSLPLLMAALQKGGFNIVDTNGKPLYLPRSGPGLDISFIDFEVAGMLRAVGMGVGTSFAKMTKVYAGDGSSVPEGELAHRMLADLRAMRNSDDPHVAFLWGFISEMSRITPELGDLTTAPPTSIKLNMIQASIIERLFLRDLLVKFEILSGGTAGAYDGLFPSDPRQFFIAAASWRPAMMAECGIIDDIADLKKAHKTGGSVGETLKTYKETLKDYNHVLDLQKSQKVKGSSIASSALAWAKVIMAFMNVKAEFDLEKPMPLVRTKKSGNNIGQTREVSVKFIMNFSKTQIINCVAKAFDTATGIDLSIPDGGPIADVPVSWEVLHARSGVQGYLDVPVLVDALDRGDISRQKTDKTGKNIIQLTGKPQATDLEGQPVVPIPKRVDLRATMALDKMDAAKDIPKIVKAGIAPVIDPMGMIELAADFIQKLPLKSYRVTVPVRDWEPCTADWAGVVRYQKEIKQTIAVKGSRRPNGNSTGDGLRQIAKVDHANITLRPRSKSEMQSMPNPKPAEFYVWGKHSDITNGEREGDPCCGPLEGSYMERFRSGSEMKYSAVFQHPFLVGAHVRQRDHSLNFYLSTPTFPAQRRSFYEVDKSNCPLDQAGANDELQDAMHMLMDTLPDGRYGERYADETGEILAGTKTLTGQDNSSITWRWELVRCKQ